MLQRGVHRFRPGSRLHPPELAYPEIGRFLLRHQSFCRQSGTESRDGNPELTWCRQSRQVMGVTAVQRGHVTGSPEAVADVRGRSVWFAMSRLMILAAGLVPVQCDLYVVSSEVCSFEPPKSPSRIGCDLGGIHEVSLSY